MATAAVTLTSCATFSSDAASVDGRSLSGRDFQELLNDIAAVPGFESFLVGSNTLDADFARNLLNRWITGVALTDDLAERGIAISDSLRQSVSDELASTNGALWQEAPEELRELFIESLAALRAFSDAAAPDPETLRADYEAGIAVSAIACTRHILVETEAEAQEVLTELRSGADFAEVAAQRSIDQGSAVNGGIIEPAAGAGCFDGATFAQSLVPEFVQGALNATVGVPTDPVQSQFGWHIILLRPFDEVAEAVARLTGGGNVEAAVAEVLLSADIDVASKFGRFDPIQGAVVAIGS